MDLHARLRRLKWYYIVLYCLWFSVLPIIAGNDSATEQYPLPIAELEAVLSSWLSQSGYGHERSTLEMGRVAINAIKPGINWQFILKPHSALATEVWVEPSDNSADRRALLNNMSQYISDYIVPTGINKETINQTIPSAVLAQIESVVCIRAKAGNKNIQVSGFIFDTQGLILCTTHDLQNLSEIAVAFYNGREIKGKLVKIDEHKDLALVRINAEVQSFIALTEGRNQIKPGENVFSVGCPANLIGTVHPGTISGPPRRAGQSLYWQVRMDIYPGSSGSPVFDEHGRLIGIVKGHHRGTNTIGFLIPFETIIDFVQTR
jgi:serine protease Do